MKKLIITVSLLISACANVTYLPYMSNDVYDGTGGTIRRVNGIDIWENGTPDRKYKIIGIIDYNAPDGAPLHVIQRDNKITKKCISNRCDALILINAKQHSTGTTYIIGETFGMPSFTGVKNSRLY
ncbi:MAG: hypothetical protein H8E72_08270, partial [Candidatus Marinimicrobia bacterium]|nr:hypothetical protein [Candidatus Neomarinimicrobiota bacterium]